MTMPYYLDLLLQRSLAQRTLLLLGTILLVAALDYVLVYRPQAGRIVRATAALELARLDEARLRRELERLPGLRKELAGLRRERQSRFPRVAEPSTLLESVTARAALARLEVVRFHPEAAVQAEYFTEIPMKVELQGSFHEFLGFLDLSAESHRLPSLRSLAIQALGAEEGRMVLRIALDMAMLRLLPEEETTPVDVSHAAGAGEIAVVQTALSPDPAGVSPLPGRDPFQPYPVAAPPNPDGLPGQDRAQDPPPAPDPAPRFQAVGIVWQKRAAVALVQDAEGYGHVVQPGSRLDGGRVRIKAITPCEVVMETARPGPEPRETRLKVPRCSDTWLGQEPVVPVMPGLTRHPEGEGTG